MKARKVKMALMLVAGTVVAATFAPPASARSTNCERYVSVSYVTLSATNTVSGVRPSCIDALGIAYRAIVRNYPRRVSTWWRGRVLSATRTAMYDGDYMVVVYTTSRQKVGFISWRGRIAGIGVACHVLTVQC